MLVIFSENVTINDKKNIFKFSSRLCQLIQSYGNSGNILRFFEFFPPIPQISRNIHIYIYNTSNESHRICLMSLTYG